MDRRDFLKTAVPAAAALSLGLAGCNDDTSPEPPTGFPALNFVTRDPAFSDYRPAIDSSGSQVIFERTPAGGVTSLYLATSLGPSPTLRRFLPAVTINGVPIPPSQTRPDWNWITGNVAVNVALTNTTEVESLTTNVSGSSARFVPNGRGHLYPIWNREGTLLIVYNNSGAVQPVPSTTLVNLEGAVQVANLNGRDANGVEVFGGFAAPMPGDATRIAFAGQPNLATWGPPTSAESATKAGGTYNQDYNYVFLNAKKGTEYVSAPLEPGATLAKYNTATQGRAPYWSPNGRYIVFESDRAGGYALFLADTIAGTAPVQLTDIGYQAQHAKFFPSGDRLIFTALQTPGGAGPRGIAWIDISSYIR
jgi:hypothetical protein